MASVGKKDSTTVILISITLVLCMALYFNNRMAILENEDGNMGANKGDMYLTNVDMDVDMGRRTSEINLSDRRGGRRQMRILRTDPTMKGGMENSYTDASGREYSNLRLPFQVIGGGHRMIPTYGGSQTPIANPTLPVDISSANIAPVNVYQPDMTDSFRQVGVIMRVFGENNQMLPLFGREKWPNSNKWLYYTNVGKYGVSLPVKSAQHRGYDFELQNNDEVVIKGIAGKYRITTYDTDSTDYIPVNV